MKKELKDQWIAALESGDYKQGRMMLRSGNDEYCCLGVLCELFFGKQKWLYHHSAYKGYYSINDEMDMLSEKTLDSLGLHDDEAHELMSMNDTLKKPFTYIAQYIRESL